MNTTKNTHNIDKFKLILAMTIFGTIGLLRKYIPYSSALVAFARGVIGAAFLLILHKLRKEKFLTKDFKKNIHLLIISGICLGVNWMLLFEAYEYTSISVATITYYMAPVMVILISPLLFHEKLTSKKCLCSAIAVLGMVLVSGVLETGFHGLKGIAFGLAAAILYAAVVILNKKIAGISANDRTIFQLSIAAVSLLPYVILTTDIVSIKIDILPVILLLMAGILHTGVAYYLYFNSIHNIPAQTAALFSYIDPIIAVLVSSLILREGLSISAFIGIILVIGATAASEIS